VPDYNALQIALRSIHFDRVTTRMMFGYVIGLAQRNIDGDGQLYVSQGSFKVRRDGRVRTKDDEVYTWDGDGELVFSTKLEGLERVGLDLYFVRDRRRLREFGGILRQAFGKDEGVGTKLADVLTSAIAAANPVSGAIVALTPQIARFVGKLLEKSKDKVKIRAEGSLKISTLMRDLEGRDEDDDDSTHRWGVSRADKGYFETEWDLVTMANPEGRVIQPELPADLADKFR
jgi:hypothetical protein